jgi:long-chain fatty acid transport protein
MKKILALLLLAGSAPVFAGGFQLNVQSPRALGMGGAYAGFARGTESVFFNPGGMCNLKGHNFTLGGSLIFPLVSLQTAVTDNINQTSPVATPVHFYYGGEIFENLYAGLAINNQFGSSSSFEDDWEGRFIVQNISLKTFTFQPTVAYKIHPLFSLGAGFMLTTGNFSYEKAVPVGSDDTDYGKAKLSGKGIAYGFNVGFFSTLIDNDKMKLTLGGDYRSGQLIKLEEGTAEFSDIPQSLEASFPAMTTFTGELNLPSVITAGFAYQYNINDKNSITLTYDFVYTGWSSYDTLAFDFANEDTPDSKTTKAWQDTPTQRFGIEYALNEMFFFRVGGYYDVTPIQDGYVSPELPDADQFVPTFGFGMQIGENVAFDLAWLHQDTERTASLDDEGFNAKYHRIADVISLSATIKF